MHRLLVGAFISRVHRSSFSKGDAASIDRDSDSSIGEDASLFLLGSDFNFGFRVKWQLLTGINQDQFREIFGQPGISGAEQDFILPLAPVKLPRSLEQLKELTHDRVFRRIRNDPDHASNFLVSFEQHQLYGTQLHGIFFPLKEVAHQTHQCLPLVAPYVCQINLLPSLYDLINLFAVGEYIFDFLCKVLRVAGLEEKERFIAEIILNAGRVGSNYWLPQSQVLKDSSRGVNLRKRIPMIRNDADVTFFDSWYKILESLRPQVTNRFIQAYDSGVRNGKISLSGEFMITPIFSGRQLREPKIRLHATLTVNTKLARAMLHFSIRLVSRTISLSLSRLNIVIMSSGIGSCRSRITFAPSAFGINELTTRMSGILCTYTKS